MVASEFLTPGAHPALVVSCFRIPMRYPTTVAVDSLTLVEDALAEVQSEAVAPTPT